MKVTKPKDPCIHCGTPVTKIVCPFKLSKLKQIYFFTHTLQCKGCGAIFHQDKWKITKADVIKQL